MLPKIGCALGAVNAGVIVFTSLMEGFPHATPVGNVSQMKGRYPDTTARLTAGMIRLTGKGPGSMWWAVSRVKSLDALPGVYLAGSQNAYSVDAAFQYSWMNASPPALEITLYGVEINPFQLRDAIKADRLTLKVEECLSG